MFGIEDFSKPLIDYSNFDPSQLKDVLLFGGSVLLIGIGTIFAVLCLIWFALIIFEKVFMKQSKPKIKEVAPAPIAAPVPTSTVEAASNDEEIVAVIAAAIAMAESESDGLKFRVVSFRRK